MRGSTETFGHSFEVDHEPRHQRNVALRNYWNAARTPEGPLRREDLDVSSVVDLLPGIFMAEPVEGDYRIRLSGTGAEGRLNLPFTGQTLVQLHGPELGQETADIFREAAETFVPLSLHGSFLSPSTSHILLDIVLLSMRFPDSGLGILGGLFPVDE